jgi:hypothetical protein
MGSRGMRIGFYWTNQKERDDWEDLDVGGWDNIKMGLREIRWGGMDWIHLGRDRDQ